MSAIVLGFFVAIGWLAKQILGSLLTQQARGSLAEYAAKRARAASKLLPAELAEEYREEWLAGLLTLETKPLSAVRYACGLERAARGIAGLAGACGHYSRQMRVAYRIVDVGISAIGLTVMAPVLMIVAVALRLARPRPILSRDTRIGDYGRFHQLRFRTRSHRTRPDHGLDKLLERTALDQLPLMINVLRGDMSIIGTPAHPTRDGRTSAIDGAHKPSVRPGLTSWQLLCALGTVDLTPSEARERDRERGLRNEVDLMLRTCRLFLASRS